MRNYVQPNDPPATENYSLESNYVDAVECANQIRDWSTAYATTVEGRLTDRTNANQTHADKISECNGLQGGYELGFCNYRFELTETCSVLDHCFDRAEALFNATRELILESNETRFRSFLVAKKVICYVEVLLRNLTIEAIHQCDQQQIDTSELDFTIEPLPAKSSCDVSLVSVHPCDAEWISSKYTSKDWYVDPLTTVENAPCASTELAGVGVSVFRKGMEQRDSTELKSAIIINIHQ
eukprot:Skav201290  [mRNA]  locus=scaffold37:113694:114410:+ [translate_table: standard]